MRMLEMVTQITIPDISFSNAKLGLTGTPATAYSDTCEQRIRGNMDSLGSWHGCCYRDVSMDLQSIEDDCIFGL
jgi:hypothetical protein